MIIDELTHEDIMQTIEHLQAYCACRENCTDCHYGDEFGCALKCIPAKWRPEAIKERGDQNDQGE